MSRFVVMGVSGCGKSSIGQAFARAIGAQFIDADDLHPRENIEKMARGEPLTDEDRAPWLDRVGHALQGEHVVVACSALRRVYRDRIRCGAAAQVWFLHLHGGRETLTARMAARPGHFMPIALLDSQLALLEPPMPDEVSCTENIEQSPEQIVARFQEFVLNQQK